MHRTPTVALVLLALLATTTLPLSHAQSDETPADGPGANASIECSTELSAHAEMPHEAAECASSSPTVATEPEAAPPVPGELCPAWVHDAIVTTGPDGKSYPTWHPAVDPATGCLFGHEHGADPATSRANSEPPAFGYAAAQMGMVEPHVGFKVFVLNAGDVVESNVPNKVATDDVRLVFHMGTGGVKRYTEQFHSMQLDFVARDGSERYAHVQGMADTGPADRNGSTCDLPRKGSRDFSTLGCGDSYEIWNFTRFQVIHPDDPFTGINETRFGAIPSVAVFDPITTRDPSDNSLVVYTQEYRGDPLGRANIDPLSPDAHYQGCRREFYAGPMYWHNAGQETVYYSDVFGQVSPTGEDAMHPLRQEISAVNASTPVLFKVRQDFCGDGVRPPN